MGGAFCAAPPTRYSLPRLGARVPRRTPPRDAVPPSLRICKVQERSCSVGADFTLIGDHNLVRVLLT